MEEGYPLLAEAEEVTVSMVAAAAPNIRFARELSDKDLIYNTVQSIFVAPRLTQPEVNTLILGAWGCGAFGGDPNEIATLFVRALISDSFGELYQNIHFAIPKLAPTDNNYDVFFKVLRDFELSVTDLDLEPQKGGGDHQKGAGKGAPHGRGKGDSGGPSAKGKGKGKGY